MLHDEKERLKQVNKYLELNFNELDEFQNIVELAAKLCEKPVALITLLGEQSNWLKVRLGTDIEVMPCETSFCQHAIAQDNLMVIADASKDPRFVTNPLVHLDPKLKFYAGAPLVLSNGFKLGTLCLFDLKPNKLTETQQEILAILSRQVISIMELEMSRMELIQQVEKTEAKNVSLTKIAQLQAHQIRQPLTTIMGLVSLVKDDFKEINQEWLGVFETALDNFDQAIGDIVAESIISKDVRALRFTKMVEEIDDYAILLLDEQGTIENWNSGAEKIKGYQTHEILGKNFSVFYTKEDIEKDSPRKLIQTAQEHGVARDVGWRVRKGGEKFWGSIVITAIHDDDSKVIGFTKVTRDLTDLNEALQANFTSSEMYDLISEHTSKLAQVGGWELDLRNNEITWTAITRELHGVDKDYIPDLASGIAFYSGEENKSLISNAIELAINEGRSWDLALEIITVQGEKKRVQTRGKSNFRNGVATKVYGTFGLLLPQSQ